MSHPLDAGEPLLRIDVRVDGSDDVITIEPANDSAEAQRLMKDLALSLEQLAQKQRAAMEATDLLTTSLTDLARKANEESRYPQC